MHRPVPVLEWHVVYLWTVCQWLWSAYSTLDLSWFMKPVLHLGVVQSLWQRVWNVLLRVWFSVACGCLWSLALKPSASHSMVVQCNSLPLIILISNIMI